MAEEIPEDRFKSEMTRMMKLVITKLEDHDERFDRLENRFDRLANKIDVLSAQISEIGFESS